MGSKPGREASNFKHGMDGTPEYNSWKGMSQRCYNPKNPDYPNYGARGIKVCDRWKKFANFYADMGPSPGPGYSIDRYPNRDGDYEPSNCRWANYDEQLNNTRRNAYYEYNGETLTRSQLARKVGLNNRTLTFRLNSGMSLEEAISKDVKKAETYEYNGLTKTLREWADLYGMSYNVVYQRIRAGKSIADALKT